ncbi:MAG: nucleotide exchange factor GrpE [Candidatus Neomarinimicrobiota bacterium]|nr:nucleotide exchange factor GrpE [Candidatus Neomarinimicrobiota bacterium]MCH2650619.1 nucleotide exchange factor GrpE [Candidatus Neomarinimicrobiota bacterium]MEC7735855.1 nucleotide exchange factor GrpE [Candidatus Neomarinimicrobiota bacterium]
MPKTSNKEPKKKTKQKDVKKKDPKHSENHESKNLEEQLKVIQDKHIRLKAEFENFRRRKADEISRLLQFEGENAIRGFLPILDDLERMIHSSDASEESLKDGVSMVESKIQKYFESLSIKPFGEKGDEMDPDIHDAMLTQTDKKMDDNSILEVFEKGYTYRDKVIRHAKVIVNKK